jgi:hypothetical protein
MKKMAKLAYKKSDLKKSVIKYGKLYSLLIDKKGNYQANYSKATLTSKAREIDERNKKIEQTLGISYRTKTIPVLVNFDGLMAYVLYQRRIKS